MEVGEGVVCCLWGLGIVGKYFSSWGGGMEVSKFITRIEISKCWGDKYEFLQVLTHCGIPTSVFGGTYFPQIITPEVPLVVILAMVFGTAGNNLNPSLMHANSYFKLFTDVVVISNSSENVLWILSVRMASFEGLVSGWHFRPVRRVAEPAIIRVDAVARTSPYIIPAGVFRCF